MCRAYGERVIAAEMPNWSSYIDARYDTCTVMVDT